MDKVAYRILTRADDISHIDSSQDLMDANKLLEIFGDEVYDFWLSHYDDFEKYCKENPCEEYSMCEYVLYTHWAEFVRLLREKYC